MKQSYGTEKPKETYIEVLLEAPGAPCAVHFNENITEETVTDPEGNELTEYTAEHYSMEASYRDGLEEAILENRAAWLAAAVESEKTGKAKTEIELLRDGMAELKAANASLESAVNDLTVAVLEGGI